MDHSFSIQLDNVELFHGSSFPLSRLRLQPTWFAHTSKTANAYGKFVYTFKSKAIILLDIQNQNFHNDFMSKLNNYYATQRNTHALRVLAPLGLPDYKTQMKFMEKNNVGLYPENARQMNSKEKETLRRIEEFSGLYGNKHRFSLQKDDDDLDREMVDMMRILYPNFDGYTCQSLLPSYHMGGFMAAETCLFNPEKVLKSISCHSTTTDMRLIQKGGLVSDDWIERNPHALKINHRIFQQI